MGRMCHLAESFLFYHVVAKMAKFLFGLNNYGVYSNLENLVLWASGS
jgi:hypothetical protein